MLVIPQIFSLSLPFRGKIESVKCGNMITILWGKTAGSIFMAGCVDHIRKECNMTPKQWYEMGDSVIQVTKIISCHAFKYNSLI